MDKEIRPNKKTFAGKAIIVILILSITNIISGLAVVILLYKSGIAELYIWLFVVSAFAVFLIGGYYLINRWIRIPYLEFRSLFHRFVKGQIYSELLDKSAGLFPEIGDVFLRFDELVDRNKTIQVSTKQAELLALQNQINPHFLYNTLDAIRGDALCAGMDNIADITEALSTYFRYTITETSTLVTLMDELENVDNYFMIQQYRFGERLKIQIDIPEEDAGVLQLQCPKLMLQPIVENAIFHGLEKRSEGGTIKVEIEKTDNRVLIHVRDDGVGIEEETLKSINQKLEHVSVGYIKDPQKGRGGIALNNVCRRIKLLFGEEYGIHVYSFRDVGTHVCITLPIIQNERRNRNEKGTAGY